MKTLATSEYPTPAHRPANSRLDTAGLTRDFGIVLPPWQDSVATIVRDVLEKEYR